MNRFGPEVAASIQAARATGVKVSIFDDNGCLLWFCHEWESDVGKMAEWKQALGWGWLEFVHPDDLPVVQNWIHAGSGALVEFRSIAAEGPDYWQTVRLIKRRVGLYWLAVGERSPPRREFTAGLGLVAALVSQLLVPDYWTLAPRSKT